MCIPHTVYIVQCKYMINYIVSINYKYMISVLHPCVQCTTYIVRGTSQTCTIVRRKIQGPNIYAEYTVCFGTLLTTQNRCT